MDGTGHLPEDGDYGSVGGRGLFKGKQATLDGGFIDQTTGQPQSTGQPTASPATHAKQRGAEASRL